MTSARSYFCALVITAAAMASRNIAAHEGSRLAPPHSSGPAPASSPSIVCAATLRTLGGPKEIQAALVEGMVKFFRNSQIDSDRLREFLRNPLSAQINWNSGADLNSHAQAITLFQTFARDLQPDERSQLIADLTAALQALLAERETSQTIAQKSLEQTAEIPLVTVFNVGSRITNVVFLPDEKHILTNSSDEVTRLWDITTGGQLSVLPDGISGVAVSYDGRFFRTYYSGNESRFWDLEDKIRGRILKTNEDIICSSLFHDGRSFLTGSYDGTAKLWNPQTGEEIKRFIGHSDSVQSGTFSPDGRHVLTGSYDGTARLWNTETGLEVRVFVCKMISLVVFSPNGRSIVTGSWDGTARLWPLPPQFWPRKQETAGLLRNAQHP